MARLVVAVALAVDRSWHLRFWPVWHPATRGVAGDVDHPAQLGDQIIEHVTIAGVEGSGTWTVVEYDRPVPLGP